MSVFPPIQRLVCGFLCLLLFAAGGRLLWNGGILWQQRQAFVSSALTVEAVVSRADYGKISGKGPRPFLPTFCFQDALGEKRFFTSQEAVLEPLQLGQHVPLLYNSTQAPHVLIHSFSYVWEDPVVMLGSGALLTLLGVLGMRQVLRYNFSAAAQEIHSHPCGPVPELRP